ncbi:type II toxin-antitoxin system VapC family toxin [Cysteiniphilum sp. 6C5]|uniref:type II toxin-antitoxin system VapC family toxin n=1 Tax=unclassified Cysteiniphilum TaxID=2610889 RepID=UPI003F830816
MLDTNICIFIINEKPPAVLERFKQYKFNEIAISSIVYSELVYGAYKSKRIDQNISALAGFVAPLSIVEFDQNAANDLLIAAYAKSLNIPLVTNNTKDFKKVDGLTVLDWVDLHMFCWGGKATI